MRKFLIITLAFLFVLGLSGLAMAASNIAKQDVDGDVNTALIEQVGSNNVASQRQKGDWNIAVIWQDGSSNTDDFTCDALDDRIWDWNHIDGQVYGHRIVGFDYGDCCEFDTLGWMQFQKGGLNEAYIDVSGSNNHTCQWQSGPLWEDGDYNYAEILIEGEENNAKQVQLGNYNEAYIGVVGDKNTACQYQEGYGNFAETLIDGDYNCACVIQTSG